MKNNSNLSASSLVRLILVTFIASFIAAGCSSTRSGGFSDPSGSDNSVDVAPGKSVMVPLRGQGWVSGAGPTLVVPIENDQAQ